MLNVILGETLEHKRFFDQALAGRADLLGRRADGAGTGGGVLDRDAVDRARGGERATNRPADDPVAIALGSNLGDRRAAMAFAAERLALFSQLPSSPTSSKPSRRRGGSAISRSI